MGSAALLQQEPTLAVQRPKNQNLTLLLRSLRNITASP